ncbi:hypothetical protein CVT25_008123 [Psilocybe cyanescens]|uniref:Uncharacterized protein n=1 Tax=Psilocybe cyanescens TaxID=93625 RepID=A0A409X9N5_PSICY|nr:hypothetical protein CVT25_008123 [Psilocybe cyanescens]
MEVLELTVLVQERKGDTMTSVFKRHAAGTRRMFYLSVPIPERGMFIARYCLINDIGAFMEILSLSGASSDVQRSAYPSVVSIKEVHLYTTTTIATDIDIGI